MEGIKVHLRADSANGAHTRFTVFMNGGNCGQLCMTEKEAFWFHDAILRINYRIKEDEIKTSGKWFKEKEKYDCPIHGMSDGPDCPRC
jgi:hypothetical protein